MPIVIPIPVPAIVVHFIIKIGSLIFALCNCIITGAAIAASIVWIILGLSSGHDELQYFGLPNYVVTLTGVGILVLSILAFTFSIILVKGLSQKQPSLVKAYLIFGAVVCLVCLATGMILNSNSQGSDHEEPVLIDKIANVLLYTSLIYFSILMMIWAAYRMFSNEICYEHSEY